MPDLWETQMGLNPASPDALQDADGDGQDESRRVPRRNPPDGRDPSSHSGGRNAPRMAPSKLIFLRPRGTILLASTSGLSEPHRLAARHGCGTPGRRSAVRMGRTRHPPRLIPILSGRHPEDAVTPDREGAMSRRRFNPRARTNRAGLLRPEAEEPDRRLWQGRNQFQFNLGFRLSELKVLLGSR